MGAARRRIVWPILAGNQLRHGCREGFLERIRHCSALLELIAGDNRHPHLDCQIVVRVPAAAQ
jgi:hypothetical protein